MENFAKMKSKKKNNRLSNTKRKRKLKKHTILLLLQFNAYKKNLLVFHTNIIYGIDPVRKKRQLIRSNANTFDSLL